MHAAPRTLLAAAAALTTAQVVLATPGHATPAVTGKITAAASPGIAVAPYEYLGWGNPQAPASVLSATGVKWLTLAFMLSGGGCNPKWDGSRSLTGSDKTAIDSMRAAGGDVVVSFGGWSGNKLGEHCSSTSAMRPVWDEQGARHEAHAATDPRGALFLPPLRTLGKSGPSPGGDHRRGHLGSTRDRSRGGRGPLPTPLPGAAPRAAGAVRCRAAAAASWTWNAGLPAALTGTPAEADSVH
ncbi:MAG: hypothetical protein ACJ72W_16420 [Actinoallomurus sp.]